MADKKFGVKQIDLIGASGTPNLTSPNNLNINAVTVAISTDVTIGGQVTSNIIVGTGKSIGIGTTIPLSSLDVRGIVAANEYDINGSSNTLTTGGLSVNNINASGVSTFAGITTVSGATLFAKQLNVSGVSTFAGALVSQVQNYNTIMSSAGFTADGPEGRYLQLAYQTNPNYILNNVGIGTTNSANAKLTVKGTSALENVTVSGVSAFTNIQNTGITSTKDLIVSGTGNDVGSISTISLRSRNNYIDFDAAIPNTSPPQQFGIKFQGTTILGGSYSSPDGSIFLNNYNGTTALSINDSGLTLSGITTVTGSTLFAKQISVSGVVTATSFVGSNTLKSRTVVSGTTTSIVNNGIGNTNITGFKSYSLMKVGLSTAAWLRLYTDSASRTADASRSQGIDPAPGSGVIAEVITTGISTTQIITPFVTGGNLDEPASTTIYAAITNLSGTTQAITANLTILQLEV